MLKKINEFMNKKELHKRAIVFRVKEKEVELLVLRKKVEPFVVVDISVIEGEPVVGDEYKLVADKWCKVEKLRSKPLMMDIKYADILSQYRDIEIYDVRSAAEYENEHLEGAKLLNLDELLNKDNEFKKQTPVFLYCQSGTRSNIAAEELINSGYKFVVDLGGIQSRR